MRLLFVGSWFPYPPDNGSRTRYYNLIRYLSRRHSIHLISFCEGAAPCEQHRLDGMRPFCEDVQAIPRPPFRAQRGSRVLSGLLRLQPPVLAAVWNPLMTQRVREATRRQSFDLIVLAHVLNLFLADSLVFDAPVVLEEFQAVRVYERGQRAGPIRELGRGLHKAVWTRFLQTRLPRVSGITVPSAPEEAVARRLLARASSRIPIELVPNGTDLEFNHPGLAEPEPGILIFQGSLQVRDNLDATRRFMREIMPRVAEIAPAVRLRVTGALDGVDLGELATDRRLELTGYLDDVRTAVAAAYACVVPLRSGSGTRLKVLEAMALGTPVVTTSKGIEGIAAVHGKHALIADDPSAFAQHVIRLLDDPDLRAQLAVNGRHLVEEHYGWDRIGARLDRFCRRIVQRGRR
jgi:glycosyltransferase involved in cell wall biosynthesis